MLTMVAGVNLTDVNTSQIEVQSWELGGSGFRSSRFVSNLNRLIINNCDLCDFDAKLILLTPDFMKFHTSGTAGMFI